MEENLTQYEQVKDLEGNIFEWPGKIKDGDYKPSKNFTLLEPGPGIANRLELGNWVASLHIFNAFGLQVETVLPETKNELLQKYSSQITTNEKVVLALTNILEDRFVYKICVDFFHEEGRITAMPGKNSHFNASNKVMEIGSETSDIDIRLGHELIHHVTSKIRNFLWAKRTSHGMDHQLISPLEDRLRIIKLINQGAAPLSQSSLTLNGNTQEGKIYEQLQFLINERDVVTLENFTQSDLFYTSYVHSAMLLPLWIQSDTKIGGISFLDQEHIKDIAFLHAYNAALLQQVFRLALATQKKEQIPVTACFASDYFRKIFKKFTFLFARTIEQSPFDSVRQVAINSMSESLKSRVA